MGQIFLTHWEERRADGSWTMHRPGEEVAVTGDTLDRLVSAGAVGEPEARMAAPAPAEPEAPVEAADGGAERPLKTAKLEAWQDYARAVGVDPGKLSKAELIAKVG